MRAAPLLDIPENPKPGGGRAGFVKSGDVELRAARWPRTGLNDRGAVILAHGRTEFIEKYYEVIEDLRAMGFEVLTFDWRGQGLATRELEEWRRGHIDDFEDFLEDVDAVLASELAEDLPRPRFVLAHSMGGHIMLRYCHDHPEVAVKAMFSAPMLGIGTPASRPALHALTAVATMVGLGGEELAGSKPEDPAEAEFEDNPVSSDRTRWERTRACIRANHRLAVEGLSWRWTSSALASIGKTWSPSFQATYTMPTLLVAAGREKLVDPGACERMAGMVGPIEAMTVEGSLHEIMMEKDEFRDQFMDALDRFFVVD